MTLEKNHPQQERTQGMPALEQLPTGPRTAVSAAVARRLFRAAVARLDVTVVEAPTGRTYGRGGPLMRLHRPEEFYARVGRDGLIGFGEAYLTGAWDADDLAGFLTVPAARMATLVPEPLQRRRDQARQVGSQHGQETAEVLRVPGAGQVGLAEADQPVATEPGEELCRPLDPHLGPTHAPGLRGVAALAHGHRQAAYGGTEQPAGDPGRDVGLEAGRQGVEGRPGAGRAGGGRRHLRRLPVAGGLVVGGSPVDGPTARFREPG